MILKKPIALVALMAVYGAGTLPLEAQQSTPQPRTGSAETRLVNVNLFDTGASVVAKFGSPDDIQALVLGGAGGAGGAGSGPAGGPGGRGPGGGGGGAGASSATAIEQMIGDPFNDPFFQMSPDGAPDEGGARAGGPPGGPGGPGGPPGGRGSSVGGNQNAQDVIYTRWVYKRNNSRYGFVFDQFNRVVQIEAVGMSNASARTRRGITFGSTFAQVIRSYNAPDGYEINGNNIVVRYLVRDRVAFRLSKLKADGPHVVTGIVVAAGKA